MKTVVITGIGRGIGKALAQKFLAEGFKVFGTSTSGTVDFTHQDLTVFTLDLSSPESIAACADAVVKAGASLDILINNAGALFDDEETQVFIDTLRSTLEVNLIGTIDFTEKILSLVVANGHVVNISSTAGSLALSDPETEKASHFPYHYPCYKISKTALNMYTRTLAGRMIYEGKEIIVSSVHPGWVRTEMGGDDADVSPEEAADDVYKTAVSKPETGQFWFKGKKIAW
ncbi:MAG TPA: SDR family NAD(P)-dependent oxidoreductase [Candidatus Paceibacterota bacterium]